VVGPPMSATSGRSGTGDGPVYIGGLDRSGKTTMSALIGSHPDIWIPGVGSNMWTYFYGRFGDLGRPVNLERCLDAMLRYKHVGYLRPDEGRIRREFSMGEPTYARLFALFLMHGAQRAGKPRWGAQTGLIERYAHRLFDAYPGVRIVHMLRDPRDRYEASLAAWPDGRGRAGGATARWRYSTGLARRHERDHPAGYLIVRFEDLVREPEATVRHVCGFLGASFVPTMMAMPDAPTLRAKLGQADQFGPIELSTDVIGRFRGRVPPGELAFIQRYAGRMMQAHGYGSDELHLTVRQRLRFHTLDHPDHLARMLAWRAVEELQQRWPVVFPRRPGDRMLVDRERSAVTPVVPRTTTVTDAAPEAGEVA
jgi:hypothetical protein